MSILNNSSVKDALTMLYRSVQFMENRTSLMHRDEVTVDIVHVLIDTVVSAYLALCNIGGMLPHQQRDVIMRE